MLLLLSTGLKSQDDSPRPRLGVKMQMYSPLSLLVQPLYKSKSQIPFTPRFYTGEIEYSWSDRAGMLLGVGVRRLRSERELPIGAHDHRTAIKLTLAYRNYPLAGRYGPSGGLVVSPFARYAHGKADIDDGQEYSGTTTTDAISTGVQVGWQFRVKEHLLVNIGLGPELTYQVREVGDHFSDALTGLDYAGLEIWKRTEDFYFTKRIGLSPDVSIALGWLFN